MWCSSVVVVVFPFEPVMPISFPSRNRYASSISLQTVIPFDRATNKNGSSAGTPGLGTIKSCARNVLSVCPPSSKVTPAPRSFAGASPNSPSPRVSVAVTIALCPAQNNAVATPVRASPTTSTRFFRNSIDPGTRTSRSGHLQVALLLQPVFTTHRCVTPRSPLPPFSSITSVVKSSLPPSPQFQSRQREQRKHQRRNPKPYNHLALAPSQQFEMVVNRRHAKNSFPAQLERPHLQNHRERFQHEHSANKHQQHFLLDDHRNSSQRAAQRQRPHIAHKHFRGMRVIPKKSKRRAHQRPAENRQFADARDVLDLQISRPAKVAAHIRQNRHRARRDHRAANRQPVQPIRQVYCVRTSRDHDHDECQKRQN